MSDKCRLIVLTGGPGAGKTAVLEMLRRLICPHVAILPEAASILFSGGFWRGASVQERKSAQRAIFYIQKELERMVQENGQYVVGVCDRGTLDGLAYWPDHKDSFFRDLKISQKEEFSRYATVIHLRTPTDKNGYNHQNPMRIESSEAAHILDERIEGVWKEHPHRIFVENEKDFLKKAKMALKLLLLELPPCCEAMKKTIQNQGMA